MSGRQRRPLPTPSKAQQANAHEHIPTLHPAPSCPAVYSSTLDDSLEPPSKTTALVSDSVQVAVSSTGLCSDAPVCPLEKYCEPMECHQNERNGHYSQMPKQCSSPSQKQTVNGLNANLEVRHSYDPILSHLICWPVSPDNIRGVMLIITTEKCGFQYKKSTDSTCIFTVIIELQDLRFKVRFAVRFHV